MFPESFRDSEHQAVFDIRCYIFPYCVFTYCILCNYVYVRHSMVNQRSSQLAHDTFDRLGFAFVRGNGCSPGFLTQKTDKGLDWSKTLFTTFIDRGD
jgi:hypothetical protein